MSVAVKSHFLEKEREVRGCEIVCMSVCVHIHISLSLLLLLCHLTRKIRLVAKYILHQNFLVNLYWDNRYPVSDSLNNYHVTFLKAKEELL